MRFANESKFDNIPQDLKRDEISLYLEPKDLLRIMQTNKNNFRLFQPQLSFNKLLHYLTHGKMEKFASLLQKNPQLLAHPANEQKILINCLLLNIVLGAQDDAQAILKKFPQFLAQKGSVTDLLGRKFEETTVLELIIYFLDTRYMANMVLDCLPRNEEGDEIKKHLCQQYQKVQENGITYTLNNIKITEQHFNPENLFEAMENLIESFMNNSYYSPNIKRVWEEQQKLPMYFLQHYTDRDESFFPTPAFDKEKFQRKLLFCDFLRNKEPVWKEGMEQTEDDYCIIKGGAKAALYCRRFTLTGTMGINRVRDDLIAIKALYEKRKDDLILLEQKLNLPIQKLENRNHL